MNRYWQIGLISLQNQTVYRVNVLMWRVRQFIGLLSIYFFWQAVTSQQGMLFDYTNTEIVTYILLASMVATLVLGSKSTQAQAEIASGDLNNFLLKPMNYFLYWLSRDVFDKVINVLFSLFEVSLLLFILRPGFVTQLRIETIIWFSLSLILAVGLFFVISFVVSMTTFWWYQNNGWAQRFLSMILLSFLAGQAFPLDIFPYWIGQVMRLLPTAYLVYFPVQIYLDRLVTQEILFGFGVMGFWFFVLFFLAQCLWRRGLRVYGAYGR